MDSPHQAATHSHHPLGTEIPGTAFVAVDHPQRERILSPGALTFLGALHDEFGPEVQALLARREDVQRRIDAGALPGFLAETQSIRDGDWRIRELPTDLTDRRVEITGPTERKMIINALNSGARVFMADFEDSLSPTWGNVLNGQVNLMDAVRRTITYRSPEGKDYRLGDTTAVLTVRPRGWHLPERHLSYKGAPTCGALVDFGLYLYHNAQALLERGTGAYFYLPKLENYLEARLWARIFAFSERALQLPPGSIRCTVLIETILAAFEMDEVLYELRDYVAALNCGRWDYIFSFIKKFSTRPDFVLPDRAQVTMTTHFLRSYSLLCIRTCHRRGALAMGGMAAQIPIKNDPAANDIALARVRADKEREAGDGHDGTWVAHPALVPVAQEVFDRLMPTPNQVDRQRDEVQVQAADLLTLPAGEITSAGLRNNVSVSLRYVAAWLSGNGCVPIFNLMEDAATAEIARAQLWQWIRHGARTSDGLPVTAARFRAVLEEEQDLLKRELGAAAWSQGHYEQAARMIDELTTAPAFVSFLTIPGYARLAEPVAAA